MDYDLWSWHSSARSLTMWLWLWSSLWIVARWSGVILMSDASSSTARQNRWNELGPQQLIVVGKYHQKPILRIPICLTLWGLCLWPETSWETWMIQHLDKICWNNRWRSRQTSPGPRATMAKMGFSLPRRKREVLVDIMRYIHSMIYIYVFSNYVHGIFWFWFLDGPDLWGIWNHEPVHGIRVIRMVLWQHSHYTLAPVIPWIPQPVYGESKLG